MTEATAEVEGACCEAGPLGNADDPWTDIEALADFLDHEIEEIDLTHEEVEDISGYDPYAGEVRCGGVVTEATLVDMVRDDLGEDAVTDEDIAEVHARHDRYRQVQNAIVVPRNQINITFTDNHVWSEWGTMANQTGTWYSMANSTWTGWTTGARQVYSSADLRQNVTVNATPIQQYRLNRIEWEHGIQWQKWQHLTDQRTVRMGRTAQEVNDARQQEREERSRRRLQAEQERLARVEVRAKAHNRGMELLEMILSDEEKLLRANDPHGAILVRSLGSGNLYRIETGDYGVHGNVVHIDEHGCFLGRLCAAPRMRVGDDILPLSDGYVGQYLQLKHDEQGYLDMANWSHRRECQAPEVATLRRDAA